MDHELNRLLQSYHVKDADNALLERIMQRVEAEKQTAKPSYMPLMLIQRVAALVLLAVLGFSSGLATRSTIVTAQLDDSTTQDEQIYNMIINPQTLEEIVL
jgi:hypothetical protein